MRKLSLIFIFGLGLLLTFSTGCKKRKNPVEPVVLKQDDYWKIEPFFSQALDNFPMGIGFSSSNRTIMVYIPGEVPVDSKGNIPATWKTQYPVLYLLTDFGQDALFFANTYRIKDIADKLIAEGEIKPMVIVIADGRNAIGGGFYVNHPYAGNYEDYIVFDLRLQIDTLVFDRIVLKDRTKRGVSGLGMGGYAAFRVAMDYPQYYGSVSAISAPLSIDTGAAGDWFNGYLWATSINEGLKYSPRDSVLIPPDRNKPATSLLFAMAMGFSPHDTADADSSSYFKIEKLPEFTRDYAVDLPYDSAGILRPSIWSKWLNNDIQYRLTNIKPGSLANTKIYFEVGDQDSYLLQIANRNFNSFISSTHPNSYKEFTGYAGFPADHFNYAFDRLVTILKFHSQNF